jgi:protein-S-isoprenylcysteine O-methyltransferase Ste14
MVSPERATGIAWAIWVVSWWAAAAWRAPEVKRAGVGAEALHLAVTLLGFGMIFMSPRAGRWEVATWRLEPAAGWVLFAVAVAGFLLCWWARIHLGSLWSGNVTRKADHRVVDTGPYRFVRHPIYTGLILAAFATAALRGSSFAVLGAVVATLGVWIKGKIEERFLRTELGPAYDAYARRTPMLVPRFWPARAKS